MKRTIHTTPSAVSQITLPTTADLREWLEGVARAEGLRWLLAHAEDGVIWGELREDRLVLSSDAFPSGSLALRPHTLQLRLFGQDAELLVWSSVGALSARLRRDGGEGVAVECLDERYLLWGDEAVGVAENGFLMVREGGQGIQHAPPLGAPPRKRREKASHCAQLAVRHYLGADEVGVVRVVSSRLVGLVDPAGGE